MLLSGCSGAPSLTLAGTYFPAWLVCATVAAICAAVARLLMVVTGWAEIIPFQLSVNVALGVMCGLGLWLVWQGG